MSHPIKRFTLVLGAAALAFIINGCTPSQSGAPTSKTVPVPVEKNVVDTNVESSDSTATEGVKIFTVEGKSFSFSPATITVKKGDTVKIVFKNVEGFHDWVIDEFGARTSQIKADETAEVTFVADKIGTFEYYCSVGQHRAMGMKGDLIVE